MRRRLLHAVVAASLGVLSAPVVAADDAAQRAHAIMREALLQHAPRAAAERPNAGARPATTIAREHMGQTRRAEAERAAHERAAGHGWMHAGAGRADRGGPGAATNAHASSWGNWSGMGCQDAAGNQRTMDMHDGWMGGGWMGGTSGGGGMPGGGGGGGGMPGGGTGGGGMGH